MRCDDARRMISDRQDGALSERAGRKLRRHIRACEACRRYARRLEEVQAVLESMPPVPNDPRRPDAYWSELPARIRRRLEEGEARATRRDDG